MEKRMPEWVKVWGPVMVILGAMWTMNARMEDRLTARIDGLDARITRNAELISENRRAIAALGREVSELRGELKGRDLLVLEGDR